MINRTRLKIANKPSSQKNRRENFEQYDILLKKLKIRISSTNQQKHEPKIINQINTSLKEDGWLPSLMGMGSNNA